MSAILRNIRGIPAAHQALVFRDISYRGLLGAGLLFGFIALYAAFPKGNAPNWGAALIPGVLALVLTGWGIRRRFQSSGSWLMMADAEGLHINMTYVEGYPVKGTLLRRDDASVLFLPREEISEMSRTREVLRLPHRFGATRHHFGYLDIALRHDAPQAALAETTRLNDLYAAKGKSGPFPIRFVNPHLLRLCWSAIYPDEAKAIRRISPPRAGAAIRAVTYPEWDALSVEQRDIFLNELWAMGMRREALFLARLHFGVSIKKAADIMNAR